MVGGLVKTGTGAMHGWGFIKYVTLQRDLLGPAYVFVHNLCHTAVGGEMFEPSIKYVTLQRERRRWGRP
jgi:hypothetical protein